MPLHIVQNGFENYIGSTDYAKINKARDLCGKSNVYVINLDVKLALRHSYTHYAHNTHPHIHTLMYTHGFPYRDLTFLAKLIE